jgi:hypothetical protein
LAGAGFSAAVRAAIECGERWSVCVVVVGV